MTQLAENYELLTKMLSSGKVSPKDTDAGGCLFALPETINWTCQEKCSLKTHKDASGWKNDHVFCSGA